MEIKVLKSSFNNLWKYCQQMKQIAIFRNVIFKIYLNIIHIIIDVIAVSIYIQRNGNIKFMFKETVKSSSKIENPVQYRCVEKKYEVYEECSNEFKLARVN